jgi:uncharacterized protein with GYD domain
MPRFLVKTKYETQGVKSVLAGGGTARRSAIEKTIGGLGGQVETFDFAFGEDDLYVIVNMPDAISAAAVAMTINASGRSRVTTTLLWTPEEIDAAARQEVSYAPPAAPVP